MFKRENTLPGGYTLYELTDHLGNVRAVIMKSGSQYLSLTSKTDYYPFGMPMPNRHTTDNNYRYAFQGQEKDPETGMEAFELRLWDGRIGRWLTIDPYHEFFSPYLGMGNNPISLIDPDGGMTEGGGDCPTCPNGQWQVPFTASYGPQQEMPIDLGVLDGVVLSTIRNFETYSSFTPYNDVNNLLTLSINGSNLITPLDVYSNALSNNKFVYNLNGNLNTYKNGYFGGGRGKISAQAIKIAKIETKLLGSIGNGLKYTSRGLSFIGFVSTETEYRLGSIDENRRDYDHALNVINTRFPVLAFGTIPGNYLGQRYHKEIVHEITDENTVTVKIVSKFLNFVGLPASKEEIKK